MPKLKTVRVKLELMDQVEKEVDKSRYRSISDFISEAIQLRLRTLTEKRIFERLEHSRITGVREYTCQNEFIHNINVVTYDDSSIWVMCPMFGWFEEAGSEGAPKLGCKERKKRCTWFVG